MQRNVFVLMSLLIASAMIGNLLTAAPPPAKEPAKDKPVPGVFRLPKHIEPSADQQAKLDLLAKKYLPKVRELEEKVDAVYTAEQRQARDRARKAAHEAGLKGKEANERVETAVKLTPEQSANLAAVKDAKHQLDEEIRVQVMAMLTPEQKQAMGPPEGKPHPKKPGPPHGEKGPKPEAK